MAGNSFGKLFRITTFGESHGYGIGVVIDGCPSEISLRPEDFKKEMARRRPYSHPLHTKRKEEDRVEILSGVFEGKTTGAPIMLFIHNRDVDSRPYMILRSLFRPGHADFTYFKKYRHFDFRGGGRYSARETAARVAAGVVAGKVLDSVPINVTAYTLELGGIRISKKNMEYVEKSPVFCPDPEASKRMEDIIFEAHREGDSLGGIVEISIKGCPPGLGEPVFDKLDADLSKAIFSIGTVKGVEIGAGFEASRLKGSQNNDPILPEGFKTNNAGGILGGISNGDEIVIRVALKPIPSIRIEQDTIDRDGNPHKLRLEGRYDVCPIPRIIPVLEAMVKLVLVDHYLRNKAIEKLYGP